MILKVKGIIFDDFTKNDDGSCWSQACINCQRKIQKELGENVIDDHGGGACGLSGCSNQDGEETRYINIPARFVDEIDCE